MIYRLNLPVTDYQEMDRVTVISAAPCRSGQSDVIDLWYETGYLDGAKQGLYIFGTGHPTPWSAYTRYAFYFVDTVVTPSGLIWHVYVGPTKGTPIPV